MDLPCTEEPDVRFAITRSILLKINGKLDEKWPPNNLNLTLFHQEREQGRGLRMRLRSTLHSSLLFTVFHESILEPGQGDICTRGLNSSSYEKEILQYEVTD